MQSLIKAVSNLKTQSVSSLVQNRMNDFSKVHALSNNDWFCELCFCLLTANTSAELGLKMQNALGFEGFYSLPQKKLSKRLEELGYRFYNRRAEFITLSRVHAHDIKDKIKSFENEFASRNWLDKNIKGFGLKESSHFLRNVGFLNVAIIDRHVINLLDEHNVLEKPKTITPKHYFLAEKKLENVCKKTNLTQAELDLYLWYMKTGKVLK